MDRLSLRGEPQMLGDRPRALARSKIDPDDEPSMGLVAAPGQEVFGIISRINRISGSTILLWKQNARAALSVASHGYINGQAMVVLDCSLKSLREHRTSRSSTSAAPATSAEL